MSLYNARFFIVPDFLDAIVAFIVWQLFEDGEVSTAIIGDGPSLREWLDELDVAEVCQDVIDEVREQVVWVVDAEDEATDEQI